MKLSILLIKYIIFWRVILFCVACFAATLIPLQFSFLGGGLKNCLSTPYFWSFLNFDGEHYVSIAQNGYQPVEYFFFPVFPLAIKMISTVFDRSIYGIAVIGLCTNLIVFVGGIVGLVRLMELDYKKNIIEITILLLLLFSTSFYFASFYTESFFFAEVVWALYFARKGNWLVAGVLGALATGTRIVGLALLPAFLIEQWVQTKSFTIRNYIKPITACPVSFCGIGLYMYFLYIKTGDALAFFTSLNTVFGEQRSQSLVLLPQVFYRYFFKILPVIDYQYFPQVFTTYMEIVT